MGEEGEGKTRGNKRGERDGELAHYQTQKYRYEREKKIRTNKRRERGRQTY